MLKLVRVAYGTIDSTEVAFFWIPESCIKYPKEILISQSKLVGAHPMMLSFLENPFSP